ncbi:MAG: hypothetical protein J6J86_00135 [Lachnospiraceae bacterium]|nr:hypothetical protein [Lachnospiraceae bacterium]
MNSFSCELSEEDKRSIEETVSNVHFDDKWLCEENLLIGGNAAITSGTIKDIEINFESGLHFSGGDVSG